MADKPDGNQVSDQLKLAIKQTTAAGGAIAEFVGNLIPKELPQNSAKPHGSTSGQGDASTPEAHRQQQLNGKKASDTVPPANPTLPRIEESWLKNGRSTENSHPPRQQESTPLRPPNSNSEQGKPSESKLPRDRENWQKEGRTIILCHLATIKIK